jgi:hypothetical protein
VKTCNCSVQQSLVIQYNTVIAYCTVNRIAETRDSATTSRNVGSPTGVMVDGNAINYRYHNNSRLN